MPYVTPNDRKMLDSGVPPTATGHLNYVITQLVIAYTKRKGLSYQTINDIRGVLTGVKDEYDRRIADPYEDKKIIENGDVYQDIAP